MLPFPSMKSLLRPMFAACLLAAPGAAAQPRPATPARCTMPEGATLDRLARRLRGQEYVPPARWWKRQSSCTAVALVALARGPHRPLFVRIRALWALRFFPRDEARAYLREATRRDDLPVAALRMALGSLVHLEGPRALPLLLTRLTDPRPAVRLAAARALLRTGAPKAREAVLRAQRTERDPGARRRLRQMLLEAR